MKGRRYICVSILSHDGVDLWHMNRAYVFEICMVNMVIVLVAEPPSNIQISISRCSKASETLKVKGTHLASSRATFYQSYILYIADVNIENPECHAHSITFLINDKDTNIIV